MGEGRDDAIPRETGSAGEAVSNRGSVGMGAEMTITYYVARTANGLDTFAQMRKSGTSKYGYRTAGIALRYTPPGGYVEERHTDGCADWGGRVVAEKPE